MKKIFFIAAAIIFSLQLQAQNHYWVMLTDKTGSTFDPYSYFDAKAIERYRLNNADLYDISNYPLNESYVSQIDAIATDDFGQSRWFNAVAVTATPEQIAAIQKLPFVKQVIMLQGEMQICKKENVELNTESEDMDPIYTLTTQLIRMGGEDFRKAGINGKGVRIAVFDGGFPQVNTHKAFKHLRDNNQIIKTWNFPNKKENVYGWNSHGLMTLSCIAGIHRYEGTDGEILVDEGLATGAEFLLARTEVNTEPKKEEVWWQMAVEWADKNGAQIISSSLGYGKDRYYTKDMDGQSLVAKAGNMAARKGILVCNSAGNEGSDRTWRTIITPSDADSVLCVGGITNSLSDYEHISFSSYGPSADGRQKPNVVAFGHAHTANTGKDNDDYHYVDGTSFSCPLVAGFAACALQAKPGLTAMQLFHEIEKSGDLYPYCDYTYGYGVPQAGYFTGDRKEAGPTFKFVKDTDYLRIEPIVECKERCFIFIKNSRPDGKIINYDKIDLPKFEKGMSIEISGGDIVTAQYNGYAETYNIFENVSNITGKADDEYYMSVYVSGDDLRSSDYDVDYSSHFSETLNEKKSHWEPFFMLGIPVALDNEMKSSIWSPVTHIGVRGTHYFTKGYGWGFGIEYFSGSYRFGNGASNDLETMLGLNTTVDGASKLYKRRVETNQLSAEIYQRVRLIPAGLMHKGLHWDLGAYISIANNTYRLKYSENTDLLAENRDIRLKNVNPLRGERLQYGVTTRITYDIIGIYGRYNLHRLGKTLAADEVALPALEVGLQVSF